MNSSRFPPATGRNNSDPFTYVGLVALIGATAQGQPLVIAGDPFWARMIAPMGPVKGCHQLELMAPLSGIGRE